MSILQWLKSGFRGAARAVARRQSEANPAKVAGPGHFAVMVVGESHYTDSFKALFGARAYTRDELNCLAVLRLLDDNRHDKDAVGVYVNGHQVGHLGRADALSYRRMVWAKNLTHHRVLAAEARVYAGDERGLFSVRLDLPL